MYLYLYRDSYDESNIVQDTRDHPASASSLLNANEFGDTKKIPFSNSAVASPVLMPPPNAIPKCQGTAKIASTNAKVFPSEFGINGGQKLSSITKGSIEGKIFNIVVNMEQEVSGTKDHCSVPKKRYCLFQY